MKIDLDDYQNLRTNIINKIAIIMPYLRSEVSLLTAQPEVASRCIMGRNCDLLAFHRTHAADLYRLPDCVSNVSEIQEGDTISSKWHPRGDRCSNSILATALIKLLVRLFIDSLRSLLFLLRCIN